MDKREALRSMLNNVINDNHEQAALDMHNYFTVKMREVAGVVPAAAPADEQAPNQDD